MGNTSELEKILNIFSDLLVIKVADHIQDQMIFLVFLLPISFKIPNKQWSTLFLCFLFGFLDDFPPLFSLSIVLGYILPVFVTLKVLCLFLSTLIIGLGSFSSHHDHKVLPILDQNNDTNHHLSRKNCS